MNLQLRCESQRAKCEVGALPNGRFQHAPMLSGLTRMLWEADSEAPVIQSIRTTPSGGSFPEKPESPIACPQTTSAGMMRSLPPSFRKLGGGPSSSLPRMITLHFRCDLRSLITSMRLPKGAEEAKVTIISRRSFPCWSLARICAPEVAGCHRPSLRVAPLCDNGTITLSESMPTKVIGA